jgi:toxin ParE1/3/4
VSKPVFRRPRAAVDIADIARFLAGRSLPAALRFIDDVEAACALLAEHPAAGSQRHAGLFPDLPAPLRFHSLKRSDRILIYYVDFGDRLEVIRVWDAARGLEALLDEGDG